MDMQELIKQRGKQAKKIDKKQFFIGLILFFFVFILSIFLYFKNEFYGISLFIGCLIGFTLRKSRFCFASAFKDPILFKNTKILRGLILALIISTIGFYFIQIKYLNISNIDYGIIPGEINAVGIHTMIGAFLFGIGTVLSGGCASGVLYKFGEGNLVFLVAIIGFIIGTLIGAKNYSFWYINFIKNTKVIYFMEYLNPNLVLIIQLIVLIIIYVFLKLYQDKN